MMNAPREYATASLDRLFAGLVEGVPAVPVVDLALDSRAVQPGGLFLALQGGHAHGLAHLDDALARCAAAVAWEPAPGVAPPTVPAHVHAVSVPLLRERLGTVADRFFDAPSAQVATMAVTGTNGKTTVAWLVAGALERLGRPCTYVGTLGAGRLDNLQTGRLTTPDVISIHRHLADARDAGTRCAVLEASSHALVQARLAGVRVAVAAFTNLTPEHQDYHGDMRAYGGAKLRLFRQPGLRCAVVNHDDAFATEITATLGDGVEVLPVTLGPVAGDGQRWLFGRLSPGDGPGLSVLFDCRGRHGELSSRMVGRFNASNLLLALGMLVGLGVDCGDAARALSQVPPPPGRMQVFGGAGRRPLVVVDFAHTPDALERALEALREHRPGARLACVFGCGGDRDRRKRALMGEVAARMADRVILTDDNPRGEDPAEIVASIRAGMPEAREVTVEHDRARAIRLAITEAASGDMVLVAGKGHEREQHFADHSLAFSDERAVRDALECAS